MKRPFVLLLVLTFLILTATSAAATGVASDAPKLVISSQIGDMRMGESEAQVGYDYGSDCISGCQGIKDGCVLGLRDCVGPTYNYTVAGGYLRVGYNGHHVVLLETNDSRYISSTGLHVGSKIAFGTRWRQFRWHACSPSDGYWVAGTSWSSPLWKNGTKRWWTQLGVDKGLVTVISMWRGDVNIQEC
jgi:hypothetical protein